MLERVPVQTVVVEILRPKYVGPQNPGRAVIVGELPPRVIDKGMAGSSMLADIVVSDHLPLSAGRHCAFEVHAGRRGSPGGVASSAAV